MMNPTSSKTSLTASVAALLLTAAGGCTVGPKYSAPAAKTPPTFSNADRLPRTGDTNAVAWWTTFQDARLSQLMSQATTNNLELRRAQHRLQEARALWTEARFDVAPTARANGSFDRTQISREAAGTRERLTALYRAGFDATWELDLWGAVRRNVEAAKATVGSVEASLADLQISLQAEVAVNYLELRGLQSHLEVATQNATNQALTLNLAIALLNGGQGTQLDVARARTLHNETLASIPPLELGIERSIHRLSVLCGLPPAHLRPELLVPAPLPAPGELRADMDPARWIRRRPDIRAAERALAAATARIGVQTADLFPRVTFNGSIGVQAKSIGAFADNGSDTFSFGPHISWAAFDLGRIRQRIQAADARAAQALDVYEQTVLLALEETENSLVALDRERRRLAYLTEAEKAATEASSLARQRYKDGVADYLSVLDAERTLLNIQEQLVAARTLGSTRLVAVFKALAAGAPE